MRAPPPDPEEVRQVLRGLLPIPDKALDTPEAVAHEIAVLSEAASPQGTLRWRIFDRRVRQALVGHVVARARHVQDELPPGLLAPERVPDLDAVFSHMTAYSKREQPGFVFGLMRSHSPVQATWLDDARMWWERILHRLPAARVLDPRATLDALERAVDEGADEEAVLRRIDAALEAGVPSDDPRLVALAAPHIEALKQHARYKHLRRAIRAAAEAEPAG